MFDPPKSEIIIENLTAFLQWKKELTTAIIKNTNFHFNVKLCTNSHFHLLPNYNKICNFSVCKNGFYANTKRFHESYRTISSILCGCRETFSITMFVRHGNRSVAGKLIIYNFNLEAAF